MRVRAASPRGKQAAAKATSPAAGQSRHVLSSHLQQHLFPLLALYPGLCQLLLLPCLRHPASSSARCCNPQQLLKQKYNYFNSQSFVKLFWQSLANSNTTDLTALYKFHILSSSGGAPAFNNCLQIPGGLLTGQGKCHLLYPKRNLNLPPTSVGFEVARPAADRIKCL